LNSTDISAKSIIIENSHTSIYFTGSLSTYEIQIEVAKVGGDGSFTLYAIGFGVAIVAVSITVIVALRKKK
jgi:hypothetical protein